MIVLFIRTFSDGGKIDDPQEKSYSPNSREGKNSDREVDNNENCGTIAANISHEVAEAMLLLDYNRGGV